MKTVGVDLSLTHTGVVALDDGKLVSKKSILTKPAGKRPVDEINRLQGIVDQICFVVDGFEPHVVAIEGLSFMSRKTTALAQLSGLNYMLRRELMRRGIGFVIVAPSSLKKFITDKGNAQKEEMMDAVYKRWGVTMLDDNENDAYCLAQVAFAMVSDGYKITDKQRSVINLITSQLHG